MCWGCSPAVWRYPAFGTFVWVHSMLAPPVSACILVPAPVMVLPPCHTWSSTVSGVVCLKRVVGWHYKLLRLKLCARPAKPADSLLEHNPCLHSDVFMFVLYLCTPKADVMV